MKALVYRAAPLLLTTMLAAAPAWAQQTSNPPSSTTPDTQMSAPSNSAGQTTAGPSGTSGKAAPMHARMGHSRQPGEAMQNLVERRIADLHSRLRITAEQSQQWDQFTQVMRANAKEIDQSYQQRAGKLGSMSAVDNMQSYADIEQQRAQDVQKLVPAFRTLYDSLSDQQKHAADEMFRTYAENAQARHTTAAR